MTGTPPELKRSLELTWLVPSPAPAPGRSTEPPSPALSPEGSAPELLALGRTIALKIQVNKFYSSYCRVPVLKGMVYFTGKSCLHC